MERRLARNPALALSFAFILTAPALAVDETFETEAGVIEVRTLVDGQKVSFDVEPDRMGKGPKAVNLSAA